MSMHSNQITELVKRVSHDHKLQRTEDTSLLSEERYPMDLNPLFEGLSKPTSLQDAASLLQWDRAKASGVLDKVSYERAKVEQNNLRRTLQLTPDTDNPWEKVQYQDWKDKVTLICLSAVQKVVMIGINHKNPLSWIYSPKMVDPSKTKRNQDDNIEGLQYLHPMLLNSPWEEPAKLDDLLIDLIRERDPISTAQALSTDPVESNKGRTKIRADLAAMKQALRRIYKLNSDTFHTFLLDLIPRAREGKSHLFTRIKAEREQHLVRQRVYIAATSGTAVVLTKRQAKAHSALHTLEFIEQNYVRNNENSVHILWTQILLHTREPMMNIYNWVVSFEQPLRRLTQCQGSNLDKAQHGRLLTLIAKQITDAEKLKITTIDTALTADMVDKGMYDLDDLKTLLATHISRFDTVYEPSANSRIMRYLRTRARDFQIEPPAFSKAKHKVKGKGKTAPAQGAKRPHPVPQRQWRTPEQYVQVNNSCTNAHCISMNTAHTHSFEDCRNKAPRFAMIGKGKGNGKGKGKDVKGRVKGGKGNPKGKGLRKGFKGGHASKGAGASTSLQLPLQATASSASATSSHTNTAGVKCYFCHQIGHYKSQCPKWQTLRSSTSYQHTRQQTPRLGLIFDHLEDAVFAPDQSCLWCTDSLCDGTNCASTFEPNDFHDATVLFMQQLQPLVANAKLDRPLDSNPPLSRELMFTRLAPDDWGDVTDDTRHEYYDQGYSEDAENAYEEPYYESEQQHSEAEQHYQEPEQNDPGTLHNEHHDQGYGNGQESTEQIEVEEARTESEDDYHDE